MLSSAQKTSLKEMQALSPTVQKKEETKGTKVIVYFHGNAEDVSHSYEFYVKLSITFKCSVIAVEYPGYGVYKSESPDAEAIKLDSELVI